MQATKLHCVSIQHPLKKKSKGILTSTSKRDIILMYSTEKFLFAFKRDPYENYSNENEMLTLVSDHVCQTLLPAACIQGKLRIT